MIPLPIRLRKTRTESGISQARLADELGLERKTIQRLESGDKVSRYTAFAVEHWMHRRRRASREIFERPVGR